MVLDGKTCFKYLFFVLFYGSCSLFGAITDLTYRGLADTLIANNAAPFTITSAFYGISNKTLNVKNSMQQVASRGVFLIPDAMNIVFGGDPFPGMGKLLVVVFKIGNSSYRVSIPEGTFQRPNWAADFVQYLESKGKSSLWTITNAESAYKKLANALINNKKAKFTITSATYGSANVQAIMQGHADNGILLVPDNCNSAFGDPNPGVAKQLSVAVNINGVSYSMNFSEGHTQEVEWQNDFVQYLSKMGKSDVWSPVLISLPKSISAYAQLATILTANHKRPFRVLSTTGSSTTLARLQYFAVRGLFMIPNQDVNVLFQTSDMPAPQTIQVSRQVSDWSSFKSAYVGANNVAVEENINITSIKYGSDVNNAIQVTPEIYNKLICGYLAQLYANRGDINQIYVSYDSEYNGSLIDITQSLIKNQRMGAIIARLTAGSVTRENFFSACNINQDAPIGKMYVTIECKLIGFAPGYGEKYLWYQIVIPK